MKKSLIGTLVTVFTSGILIAQGGPIKTEGPKESPPLLLQPSIRNILPRIVQYVENAPTFMEAVNQVAGLAFINPQLMDTSIQLLVDRITQEATREKINKSYYASNLLLELIESKNPIDENSASLAIKTLVDAGVDVNQPLSPLRSYLEKAPLIIASQNGHTEIVKALIDAGASVSPKNEKGITPLIKASENGHLKIAELLLRNNAPVDQANKYDETPLMLAAKKGNKEIVELLLQFGANVTAQDFEGKTPLLYAKESGNESLFKFLQEKREEIRRAPLPKE